MKILKISENSKFLNINYYNYNSNKINIYNKFKSKYFRDYGFQMLRDKG